MFLWPKQAFDATINLKTTIFQCSKNYDSPTRVTRLRDVQNMADPIVLTKTDCSLKELQILDFQLMLATVTKT